MIHELRPATPEEALIHYGAKGMKWGVRKAEDKASPGSSSIVPKRFTKEGRIQTLQGKVVKTDTLISDLNRELSQVPPGLRGTFKRSGIKQDIQAYTVYRNRMSKDVEAVRQGHLTSTQKQLIVGAIAIGAVAGALTYANMQQSGQANQLKLRGQEILTGKKFEFAKNESLSGKMSADDILKNVSKGVNPKYAEMGGKMNCRRSTLTHELRRRGYDVRATTSAVGYGQSESGLINALSTTGRDKFAPDSMTSMISSGRGARGQIAGDRRVNPATTKASIRSYTRKTLVDLEGGRWNGHNMTTTQANQPRLSTQHMMSTLFKQPEGSRGEVMFNFKSFGHSMAYEIIGGKPMIFDSQKGVMYDASKGLGKLTEHWGIPAGAELTRLDNMPLDMKFLSRWATNA